MQIGVKIQAANPVLVEADRVPRHRLLQGLDPVLCPCWWFPVAAFGLGLVYYPGALPRMLQSFCPGNISG